MRSEPREFERSRPTVVGPVAIGQHPLGLAVLAILERPDEFRGLDVDPMGPGRAGGGQRVLKDGVEATEQRAVQELGVIGRRQDDAGGVVVLEELQEGVEHAADLADRVVGGTFASRGVGLVEEVDASGLLERVEDEPEFCGGLAEVLRDQAVELDREQWQAELACEGRGGHGLAGARITDEQEFAERAEAVLGDAVAVTLLE